MTALQDLGKLNVITMRLWHLAKYPGIASSHQHTPENRGLTNSTRLRTSHRRTFTVKAPLLIRIVPRREERHTSRTRASHRKMGSVISHCFPKQPHLFANREGSIHLAYCHHVKEEISVADSQS